MKQIDTKKWVEFPIGGAQGLFKVLKGKRLTKADMQDGEINYIGASAMNNGITAKISNNTFLHPANTITVTYNGSIGEAFYQEEPFWASDDVNVLYPKFHLTKHIAMFMIPLIRAKGQRYAFIDKWTKDLMEESCLLLPAKVNGKPDFAYMERFMKVIERHVESVVALLVKTDNSL